MDKETLNRLVVSVTGRPDIDLGPYLMNTLAAICRSGTYAEDMYTIAKTFSQGELEFYERAGMPGYLVATYIAGTPDYLSTRKLARTQLLISDDSWEPVEFQVVASADLRTLQSHSRTCGNKPLAYYAGGHLTMALPEDMAKLAEANSTQLELTILTSNEMLGLQYAKNEYGLSPTGANNGGWSDRFSVIEGGMEDSPPWQMLTCLDLVVTGTASGILRFAGHSAEGDRLQQEFLLGLRRFKADRDNQLATLEGVLGY